MLADEGGEAVALGQYFNAFAGFYDARGADVDHLQWAACELCLGLDDGAVVLASVGVALDRYVEDGETFLRGVADFFCQQDASGAGAEGRLPADEGFERVEKAVAGEEFEEGGRFAAGDDEAVDVGQLFRLADEDGFGSGFAQGCGVGVVVALNGENSDVRRCRFFRGVQRFFLGRPGGKLADTLPPAFCTGIVYYQQVTGNILYGDRLFSMA